MKSPFNGFWFLMLINSIALFFLIFWNIVDGFELMRDGILIGVLGIFNFVIFKTQK